MGERSCIVVALTFLVLVLAAAGSAPQEVAVKYMSNQEIYEIDYRGPETHSSLPPPQSLRGTKAEPSRKRDMGSARKAAHG